MVGEEFGSMAAFGQWEPELVPSIKDVAEMSAWS